jgi:hypothetical protein
MTTQFIEEIGNIKVVNSNGLNNVVRVAQYIINCSHKGQNITNMFDVEFGEPDPATFAPFETLTKEQVLSWIQSQIGEQALTERREAMIAMAEQTIAAQEDKPKEVQAPWVTE